MVDKMEELAIAVALIRNSTSPQASWLARQDVATGELKFVIGERLESESFRETVAREVAWEFELDRTRDFLVSNMAQMNLEFIDQLPGKFSESHVKVAFYNVEIYRRNIREQLEGDPLNFWVNSEEICDGVTRCGRRFMPIVPYLINRSEVIQYWESQSEN